MVLFDLSLCQTSSQFLVSRFENSDSVQFNSFFSAQFRLMIPTDDWTSVPLFCHSFCSWLRPILRLMKVLLVFGLSGHAAWNCRLGWFRDGSDGAILLLRLLTRVGYVKGLDSIVAWRHLFGRSLRPGKPSISPSGAEAVTMVRRAPFPLSRLPASFDYAMKLLSVWKEFGPISR